VMTIRITSLLQPRSFFRSSFPLLFPGDSFPFSEFPLKVRQPYLFLILLPSSSFEADLPTGYSMSPFASPPGPRLLPPVVSQVARDAASDITAPLRFYVPYNQRLRRVLFFAHYPQVTPFSPRPSQKIAPPLHRLIFRFPSSLLRLSSSPHPHALPVSPRSTFLPVRSLKDAARPFFSLSLVASRPFFSL